MQQETKLTTQGRNPRLFSDYNLVKISIWPSENNPDIPGANVGHVSVETPKHYISLWPGPRPVSKPPSGVKFVAEVQQILKRYFTSRPPNWVPSYIEDCVLEGASEHQIRPIQQVGECKENERVLALLPTQSLYISAGMSIPDGAQLYAVTPIPAPVRLGLYSLDVQKIHDTFDLLKKNVGGWRLVGSNFLVRLLEGKSKENCASLAHRLLYAGGMYRGTLKIKGSLDTSSFTKPDVLINHLMTAKKQERVEIPETQAWSFPGESDLTALDKKPETASEQISSRL